MLVLKFLFLVVTFKLLLMQGDSLRILGVFSHHGKSHFDVFQPLLLALREKGHELTVISHFPLEKKLPNYTDVVLKMPGGVWLNTLDMDLFSNARLVKYGSFLQLHEFAQDTCSVVLASKEYKHFLKTDQEFDVIISEFFNTNCALVPIVAKFRAPFIGITSHILMSWVNNWVGNPYNPSYIPSCLLANGDQMSFWERLENTIFQVTANYYYHYVVANDEYDLIKKHLGGNLPHPNDVMLNTSLILAYTQFSLHKPKPLVPNVVEIGGLHIGKPKKLPLNIEKWISESTHGVIYFSLGSMIKGHTFPEEKRQMFLRAFARLPQRVLWKWETEMKGQPDNVMIQKWMPQFDILSHPNVKAFVAHGGLLGVTESVHCGVPMVILPQFGDQFANARAVESSGGGVVLDFASLTEEIIYDALKTVLNPEFNKKAKELSERFRDRPLPPLETAIYWVEYVARHKGAPHMRTAAVGMPVYQYLLLDVLAFLALVGFLWTALMYLLAKKIFNIIFKSNPAKPKED